MTKTPKEIADLLTDDVSYKILKSSIEGLKATTKNATQFGITPRQYYRRMAHLLKAGLVDKYGKMYKLTLLGDKVLRLYDNFAELMANSQKLRLIDKITKIEDASPFDIQAIKQALGSMNKEGVRSLKVTVNYEELVSGTLYLIDSARETLIMATRYMDQQATEAIARAVKRGVKCYFVAEEKHNLALRLKLQTSLLPNLESMRAFVDMVKAPNFKIRYKDLLYSFMVTDGKYVGIELVDQTKPENFAFGIGVESEKLAGLLQKNFEDIWRVAKEIPIEIPVKS